MLDERVGEGWIPNVDLQLKDGWFANRVLFTPQTSNELGDIDVLHERKECMQAAKGLHPLNSAKALTSHGASTSLMRRMGNAIFRRLGFKVVSLRQAAETCGALKRVDGAGDRWLLCKTPKTAFLRDAPSHFSNRGTRLRASRKVERCARRRRPREQAWRCSDAAMHICPRRARRIAYRGVPRTEHRPYCHCQPILRHLASTSDFSYNRTLPLTYSSSGIKPRAPSLDSPSPHLSWETRVPSSSTSAVRRRAQSLLPRYHALASTLPVPASNEPSLR